MSLPILMYHQIAPLPPRTQALWTLSVSPARFRSQMAWMKRLGYQGVSMRELLPTLQGALPGSVGIDRRTSKLFAITFDDGFHNVLEHAAPVLAEFGFTATCYFVSRRLGGVNDWDAELRVPMTPLMDAAALRTWAALGHEVGSHTLDHCHLPALPSAQALFQIEASKRDLEDVSGAPVESFCYPYGDANPPVQTLVRQAGYSNATMTHRGRARANDDLFDLPRVAVSGNTGSIKFLQKCLTKLEDRRRLPRPLAVAE